MKAARSSMKAEVTGLVLTRDSEATIRGVLESFDFCDEIVVVDSGSTDATVSIAEAAGARVIFNAWEGYVPQFRFALTQVRTPWVALLDSDECYSPELKREVQAALAEPGDVLGFYLCRRSFYYDRFINHSGWYPDRLFRVFHMDAVELHGVLIHQEFHPCAEAASRTRRLKGDILHYPYTDIARHVEKLNTYTTDGARELYLRGRGSSRFPLLQALGHGAARFLRQYVLKSGFRDGRTGFLLALQAAYGAFLKYVKLMELQDGRAQVPDEVREKAESMGTGVQAGKKLR